MSKDIRLQIMIEHTIPARMKAISFALEIMRCCEKYSPFENVNLVDSLGIKIDEFEDVTLRKITDPIINDAVIHSRCLLSFLGLKPANSSTKDMAEINTDKKRKDDIEIDDYFTFEGNRLERLTLTSAVNLFLGTYEKVDLSRAWARTYVIANQRLAHSTTGEKLEATVKDNSIELTFMTIPDLLNKAFYEKKLQVFP